MSNPMHMAWEVDEDELRIESPCFCDIGRDHKAVNNAR